MKEKKEFFDKLHKSKFGQFFLCTVSIVILFVIYCMFMNKIKVDKYQKFTIIEDDFSWVYQIDDIYEKKGKLVIDGWAFELNRDARSEAVEVILFDLETGKGTFASMQYRNKSCVNEYFSCEYNYSESGFLATLSLSKFDIRDKVYEILLRPSGRGFAYATGVYYSKGRITYTNPNEFVSLDVEGTDLEEIVNNGVIRAFESDYGIYIYQYGGELYWIAEDFCSFVNDDSYIQYQMNTTQIENLPKERLNNKWFWSNIGFYFTQKEVLNWNVGKYRVAKCAIPTEYSVTQIWTGSYEDGWVWRSDFRPLYEFD